MGPKEGKGELERRFRKKGLEEGLKKDFFRKGIGLNQEDLKTGLGIGFLPRKLGFPGNWLARNWPKKINLNINPQEGGGIWEEIAIWEKFKPRLKGLRWFGKNGQKNGLGIKTNNSSKKKPKRENYWSSSSVKRSQAHLRGTILIE